MKRLERRLELTGAATAVLPALEAWRESGKVWDHRRQVAEGLTAQAASAQNAAEQAVKADEVARRPFGPRSRSWCFGSGGWSKPFYCGGNVTDYVKN